MIDPQDMLPLVVLVIIAAIAFLLYQAAASGPGVSPATDPRLRRAAGHAMAGFWITLVIGSAIVGLVAALSSLGSWSPSGDSPEPSLAPGFAIVIALAGFGLAGGFAAPRSPGAAVVILGLAGVATIPFFLVGGFIPGLLYFRAAWLCAKADPWPGQPAATRSRPAGRPDRPLRAPGR